MSFRQVAVEEATLERRARRGRITFRVESVVVLAVLMGVLSVLSPFFLSVSNLLNVLLATATIGVLAIGATFVISSAGIDLSLGSVLGLAGVCGAWVMNEAGLAWPFGVVACLIAGAVAGFVNGFISVRGKIPAFIVTLGMLGVARGLALVITNGLPIYGLPNEFIYIGQGRPLGVPVPVIVFLVLAAVSHFILSQTRYGKYTLVIGDNEAAARAMGIQVDWHRISLYTFSGLMAGFAGMLFVSRVNSGDPTAGLNFELAAITAAIIGGTNLFGGRGSVFGTVIGALIMGVLQNGLNLLAVPSFYQQIAIGSVLVLAVWLDQLNRARLMR